MESKEQDKKEGFKNIFIILIAISLILIIVGIIFGPYIITRILKIKFIYSNFDDKQIFDYYGIIISLVGTLLSVMVSAGTTFWVLKSTINDNREALEVQLNTEKKMMRKQFEFYIKQRQLEGFENDLKQSVVYFSDIDMKFFYAIRDNKFNSDSSNKVLNINNCKSIIYGYIEDVGRFRHETIDKISLIKLYEPFFKKNNNIINSYITTLMRICGKAIKISEELTEELKKLLLEYSEIKDKVDERNVFIDKLNKFRIKNFQNYFNELQEKTEEDIKFIVKNFYKFILEINKNNIGEIIDGRMEKF